MECLSIQLSSIMSVQITGHFSPMSLSMSQSIDSVAFYFQLMIITFIVRVVGIARCTLQRSKYSIQTL